MVTPVALQDLGAQYRRLAPAIQAAVSEVLGSQRFVGGPEVERLERAFAESQGSAFAVGCASGSDALWLALRALEVGPGDEVICPAYSFVATASSVALLGARPVFADIDRATYTMTPETARRAATRCTRLRALVPVDLFGLCADPPGFAALGEQLGVPVVADCAQAVAAQDADGRFAGRRATLACFSFYPTKNLGAYGDAGVVVGDDEALMERVRSLAAHGVSPEAGRYSRVGINSHLDAIQAAVLRVKLPHLEGWTAARRENAACYDESFARAGAAPSDRPLTEGGLPLRTPRTPDAPARHVYHHYAIRVPAAQRDRLRSFLAERRIETGLYYPYGLHEQPCFAGDGHGPLPETELATRETLVLPVHSELSKEQRERVAETVVRFFDP
jgi:dTDP-4-amino-4,6-dideoxygalactose transaminase